MVLHVSRNTKFKVHIKAIEEYKLRYQDMQ